MARKYFCSSRGAASAAPRPGRRHPRRRPGAVGGAAVTPGTRPARLPGGRRPASRARGAGCLFGVGGSAGGEAVVHVHRGGKLVALVGNPNCGKTALFNGLTGSHQKAANYAGVTVERKDGGSEELEARQLGIAQVDHDPAAFGALDAGIADGVLQPALLKTVMGDIFDHVHEGDREYFRQSREARFGTTIESFRKERDRWFAEFRAVLAPLRATLSAQPFLGGDSQNYADYIVFGAFQFARCISPFPLLAADDPISLWRARLLESFDHLAGRAKGYSVPGTPS